MKKSKKNKKKKNKNQIANSTNTNTNTPNNENLNKINIFQKKEESKNNQLSKKKKSDVEELEEKFKKKLHNYNYILHIVPSDGNCLFSSISDQVYGTEKHNSIIREKCMDYIQKNSIYYSQFIEGGETQMPAYIERKRKNGVWADNLEIQALSEIYKRPIEIYIDVGKPISSFSNNKLGIKRFPIKISYHGNKHYNSMVPSIKNEEFILFKQELINTSPGVYETKFINDFDPNIKFNEIFFNSNNNNNIDLDAIIQDNISKDEEFLINEAIENSKIINNINNINNKEDNKQENEEDYLNNPIIQNALEFGFDLTEAIEALKICGPNQDLVINYLYDKK